MNRRPTPETDNNEYAHLFIEQNGYESPLQESPEEWADFARRLERERDAERVFADRLARYICDIHDVTSSRKVLKITTEACKTWWTHRKEARSE